MIWLIIAVVFAAGCLGGLISGLLFRPHHIGLSYQGQICGTHFPGLLGNVLLGGIAAVVFWCLYGPFSGATIVGAVAANNVALTLGQLASCLIIGLGGTGFLYTEARRRCLEEQIPATPQSAGITG